MDKQDIHGRNVQRSPLTRPPIAMSRSSVRIKTMLGFRLGLAVTPLFRPLNKVTQIKRQVRKVGRQCPAEAIIPSKCKVVKPPALVQTAQLDSEMRCSYKYSRHDTGDSRPAASGSLLVMWPWATEARVSCSTCLNMPTHLQTDRVTVQSFDPRVKQVQSHMVHVSRKSQVKWSMFQDSPKSCAVLKQVSILATTTFLSLSFHCYWVIRFRQTTTCNYAAFVGLLVMCVQPEILTIFPPTNACPRTHLTLIHNIWGKGL